MLSLLFNFCHYATFVIVPVVAFLLITDDENFHSKGGFLYLVKLIFGKRAIQKVRRKIKIPKTFDEMEKYEKPKSITLETKSESLSFTGVDQEGNQLSVKITLRADHISESTICLRLGDNIFISPDNGGVTRRHISMNQWKCHGLNIEISEPFKRCRIIFNGFLKNVSNGKIEHISIRLTWNCCSRPNFSFLDDDPNLLAKCLAKTTWRDGDWLRLLGDEKRISQFGALKGRIQRDNSLEIDVNMACVKTKSKGTAETEAFNKYLTLFAATKNGYLIQLNVKSLLNGCQELKYGYVLTTNGSVYPIKNFDLNLEKTERSISNKITVHVEAPKKTLKVVLTINNNANVETMNDNFVGYKNKNLFSECTINNHRGFAILDHWTRHQGNGLKRPRPLVRNINVETIPEVLVTPIGTEDSKILELTGGKGNALSLMKSLENEEIIVPEGFIVTTEAFNKQIETSFNLRKSIALLEDIALEREKGDLRNACEVIVELFQNHTVTPTVSQKVLDELMKLRKRHDDKIIPYLRWAVRSSGIGEDSEDFSSAGQNETFLGAQTDKDVLTKICRCWASLYSFQSVIYRKQHGLPICTSMAVVVQQMIPAESSGVLFTCHPTNSDPTKMVITSNFGLGETVVSGVSEPDTITLSKTFEGQVLFDSIELGSKIHSLLMGRYGIHKQTSDEKGSLHSLSKDQAMRLGSVGVILEEAFGSPRDIEWAFFKDQLYILQSRPVTTLCQWTDDELTHEFDSPHISDDTYYTRANIGEVSPFALTALSYSSVTNSVEKGYQVTMFRKFDPYVDITFRYNTHFCFIELLSGFYSRSTEDISICNQMVDLAVFGRPVLTEDMNKKVMERYGIHSNFSRLKEIAQVWLNTRTSVDDIKKEEESLVIGLEEKDSIIDIYRKIDASLDKMIVMNYKHSFVSGLSVVYQYLVVKMLTAGQKEIKVENYNDLSLILSSCGDVVSADVPAKLQEMTSIIRRKNLADDFLKVPADEGLNWLKTKCTEAYDLLQDFLDVHGHRLLGELELSLDTWAMDPSAVIKMLQLNAQFSSMVSKQKSDQEDVVNQLQSPMTPLAKKFIRILINRYRKAVGYRENSKSAFVKAANKFRIAYKVLGKKMTMQGLIPREALIFHFTHYELWQVLNKKNPALITKALRRERLYPSWNAIKFPELAYGMPVPETEVEDDFDISDNEIFCSGTPVCVGDVKARAVVITSLEDAYMIKQGDILITRSTDIGWSPYFPLLSGIVTELGGLVSHGAVVAREYGLPCIVSAHNATKIFKTEDMVHISGKKGSIKLLSRS